MKIAIIGAGYGGMAAAWDLVRAGHSVTIYESSPFVGGLASGFKEAHWQWSVEKFYHHWFASDAHMLGLLDELGLRRKVIFPRPLTVMYHNGKFYPFDSIINALKFPGLGFGLNKIRFGLVGLFLRLTKNWRALEKTTVDAWMRKWAGEKVYKLMWEPLVMGKFGERYYKTVNMAWMWARIHARTTRLGTYEGGFQAFADEFANILRERGVVFRMGVAVTSVEQDAGRLRVTQSDSRAEEYDRVLVTSSPALMAKIAPQLPSAYLDGLLRLESMGAVVMVLALKQKLSTQGYYWFNLPKSAGFPFLALVEHTNFVPAEKFGGETIVYAGDYLEPTHEYFSLSDEALLEKFLPAFTRINPDFKREWVRKVWVFKTAYAQPVPPVNHGQYIPSIETPVPGLFFASMSQVYPWDRGTNFAVEIGRRAAQLMMQ